MSATSGSVKVIIYALFANLGIAITKFAGALYTGSASLMAEAIHSLADCTNQIFLLIGAKKSQKPADDRHPMGYGRESFFWSFLVAILLFLLGGVFAIYEGVHKLMQNESSLTAPWVGVGILTLSILIEGGSFFACLKEVRIQNTHGSLWNWFRKSTASDLVVIFMEDLAALLGLVLALVFTLIAIATQNVFWDAMGSIVIGSLLILVSGLLTVEVKALLVGEAPFQDYRDAIEAQFQLEDSSMKVIRCIALATGNNEVLVSLKVSRGSKLKSDELIETINRVEASVKKKFSEIRWLFVEPDNKD